MLVARRQASQEIDMRTLTTAFVLAVLGLIAAAGIAEAVVPNVEVPEPATGLLLLAGVGGGLLLKRIRQ
jgi:hypothetical protein